MSLTPFFRIFICKQLLSRHKKKVRTVLFQIAVQFLCLGEIWSIANPYFTLQCGKKVNKINIKLIKYMRAPLLRFCFRLFLSLEPLSLPLLWDFWELPQLIKSLEESFSFKERVRLNHAINETDIPDKICIFEKQFSRFLFTSHFYPKNATFFYWILKPIRDVGHIWHTPYGFV